MKYSVITFGCRVNQADSLSVEEGFRAQGATAVAAEEADIVVVNTCSVTASADQAARQAIRRIARINPAARIVVTGCYATRRPDEVAGLPGVIRVVPNDDKPRLDLARFNRTLRPPIVLATERGMRCRPRARHCRPNGVHAAGADRLRRRVLLLHHPDDARPAQERADSRCPRGGGACNGRGLQGDRVDGGPSGLVWPRSERAIVFG